MTKRKKPQSSETTPPENLPPVVRAPVPNVAGLTPWTVFQAALKAVPALKYALGVLGIVSAIAIIKGFGIDVRVAVFGTIIMLILMVALVVFAALSKAKNPHLQMAALAMMWSFLALTIMSAVLLLTSTFFDYPKPLPQLLGLAHAPNSDKSGGNESDSKFEVFSHDRYLELSQWRFVPDGKATEKLSPAFWTDKLKVRRLREDAKSFCIRHATTGLPTPEFSSSIHDVTFNETTELPQGGPRPKLRIFDVCLDVSGEPVGQWFELILASIYWNAFNNQKTAWAALPIISPTKVATFEIHFPNDKPVKTWERREGARDTTTSELVTDDAIQMIEMRTLRWRIDNPQRNWVYKFVWEW